MSDTPSAPKESPVPLTEEQLKFLEEVEEEFKDRYTENDEEFRLVFEAKPVCPPIIENWKSNHNWRRNWNKRHRSGDRNQRHRGGDWSSQGESSEHGNFRSYRYRASRWGYSRMDPR